MSNNRRGCDAYALTMEYYCHKKEWSLAIFDNIDGPKGYYAQQSKSDRERQMLYDFTYMYSLKNKTSAQTWKNRVIGGCQRGVEKGGEK